MVINGITMKSISSFKREQEQHYQATVYMDGKKIGFYCEDPAREQVLCFDRGKDVAQELNRRVWDFFDRHEVPDEQRLGEMTLKELRDCNGKWPVIQVMQPEVLTEQYLRQFFKQLLLLHTCEQQYKKAVKAGFASILLIHFLKLRDMKKNPNVFYYISKEERKGFSLMEYATRMYGKKPFPAILREYSHMDDFVVM